MAGKSPEEAQFYWTGGPIEVAPKTWFASLFSGCVAFDTTDGLVLVDTGLERLAPTIGWTGVPSGGPGVRTAPTSVHFP